MDRRRFIRNVSLTMAAGMKMPGALGAPPPALRYRRLGRTGLRVSEISLGGSPLPPEAVLRQALEYGVNYVDTSSSYMNGNSERLIGKILKGRRDRLIVATKFHAGRPGTDRAALEKEFEGSLKRLDVDCVDILMIHGARSPDVIGDETVLRLFETFKKAGKIRFTGVSCHTRPLEVLPPAIRGGHFDVINLAYNAFSGSSIRPDGIYDDYLRRSGIEGLIELAHAHDVGVVAMKTMAGGDRQDLRAFREAGVGLATAKLKWVLSNPHVSTAITEMTTFDMLEENLSASGSSLSAGERSALAEHLVVRSRTSCGFCGQCAPVCEAGIAIPDIFRYVYHHSFQGKKTQAREEYARLAERERYEGCTDCRRCVSVCPNRLPIPRLLKIAHRVLA